MKFELLENGLDSLKFGIEFYDRFIDLENKYDDNPGYLKMAVTCTQNALELFSKRLLSGINELLIYKKLSDEMLLNIIKKQKEEEEKDYFTTPLEIFMLSDQVNVLTIGYKECIERLKIIFDLTIEQYKTLEEIGRLRNKLTHFGINKTIDYHEILTVLNASLELVDTFFRSNLSEKDRDKLSESLPSLSEMIYYGREEEAKAWASFLSDEFVEINEIFIDVYSDDAFIEELAQSGYELDISQGYYSDSGQIEINLIKDGNKTSIFSSYHLPKLNTTVYAGEVSNGPILFLIDHLNKYIDLQKPKHFYIYKDLTFYENFINSSTKFWEEHKNEGKCYSTSFTKDNIIRAIKNAILK
ncbi:hypothetical protein [Halalkalibacter urbisdiaboli]|uniref:hypothetical protein n=1 Tax=Halalkalibacter urbisdiaboli TaxID=1960589 RepID=UPI000B434AA8|nr:hypothetical protein [Halalkalibacter urbisdiaboli]